MIAFKGRSVSPQFVEDVIATGLSFFQERTQTRVYVSGTVRVVLNELGAVVTIVTLKQEVVDDGTG